MTSIPQVAFQPGVSRLAIDVGNVISKNDTDSGDLASYIASNEHLTPSLECAMACQRLVNLFGVENTFILSKCGQKMQLATVLFLNRSIDGGGSFLERTGMHPRNVLFCTNRAGGANGKIQLVPLNPQDKRGPRVALGKVGKGAVARHMRMTHLIDDRDDCLLSFMLEGHLASLVRKGKPMLVHGCLVHFGSHASPPTETRIKQFCSKKDVSVNSNKNVDINRLTLACLQSWDLALNEWPDVLAAFGIAEEDGAT